VELLGSDSVADLRIAFAAPGLGPAAFQPNELRALFALQAAGALGAALLDRRLPAVMAVSASPEVRVLWADLVAVDALTSASLSVAGAAELLPGAEHTLSGHSALPASFVQLNVFLASRAVSGRCVSRHFRAVGTLTGRKRPYNCDTLFGPVCHQSVRIDTLLD